MKKTILLIIVLLLASFAYAAIPTPESYYNFDVDYKDNFSYADGTAGTTVINDTACLLNGCVQFDAATDYVKFGDVYNLYNSTGKFTVVFYAVFNTAAGYLLDAGSAPHAAGNTYRYGVLGGSDKLYFGADDGFRICDDVIAAGDVFHVVMSYNGGDYLTNTKFWLNGTECSSYSTAGGYAAFGTGTPNSYELNLGGSQYDTVGAARIYDEFAIIPNYFFNDTVVSELYNSGDVKVWDGTAWIAKSTWGATPASPTASFVSPPSPADGYINNTLGQNYTAQCTLQGEPLIFAGTTNPPTTIVANATGTGLNVTSWIVNSSIFTGDDVYYLQANCSNATHTGSSVYTFNYDTAAPIVYLGGDSFFKSTNYSNANQYNATKLLHLNLTITDERDLGELLINITLADNGTSYFSFHNASLTGYTEYNYTVDINLTQFPADKQALVDIWAVDTHTAEEIDNYQWADTPMELSFNTAEGNYIRIKSLRSASWDVVKAVDRYRFTFTPDSTSIDNKYKFQVYCDAGFKEAFSGLDAALYCMNWNTKAGNWLDFEGTGNAVTITNEGEGWFEIEVEFEGDSITFESVGGLNVIHLTYIWYKGLLTMITPTSTSGNSFTLSLNLTKNSSIKDIDAGLTYNGTYYSVTETNGTGYTLFDKTLTVSVDADTTFNFTWNITVLQADDTSYSFTEDGSQTIYTLILDNCSTAATITAIFNIKDENAVNNALNGTLEVEGTYWAGEASPKNITLSYPSASSFNLCFYPNTTTIYSTAYFKYTVPSGFTHRFYWVNQSLSNVSLSTNIYNWNDTTGSSDLKITTRYVSNYAYFPNIIASLQRKYVAEGVWRTVQMDKSGDFGQLFFNIIEENTDYRLIYWDDSGNILKTTASMKFVCTSGICDLTQKLSPYAIGSSTTNTTYTVSFSNSSNQLNLTWNNPAGTDITVTTRILRQTMAGQAIVCDTNQTGASGATNCNTTGYSGLFEIVVYEDGSFAFRDTVQTDDATLSDFISAAEGAIWTFAIMVTIMMFGLFSPAGVVIATILGLILTFFMGIFNPISLTFVIIATIIGIVISFKVRN